MIRRVHVWKKCNSLGKNSYICMYQIRLSGRKVIVSFVYKKFSGKSHVCNVVKASRKVDDDEKEIIKEVLENGRDSEVLKLWRELWCSCCGKRCDGESCTFLPFLGGVMIKETIIADLEVDKIERKEDLHHPKLVHEFKLLLPNKNVYEDKRSDEYCKVYFVHDSREDIDEVYKVDVIRVSEGVYRIKIAKIFCPNDPRNPPKATVCNFCFNICPNKENVKDYGWSCDECKCYFCENSKYRIFEVVCEYGNSISD